jgi:hypothetical protein
MPHSYCGASSLIAPKADVDAALLHSTPVAEAGLLVRGAMAAEQVVDGAGAVEPPQPCQAEGELLLPTVLALPPPQRRDQPGNSVLDISSGSASIKLDALGPVVVAEDGTLSRIGNWSQMTADEQRNTQRIISERNNRRMAALRAKARVEPLD